MSRNLVISAVLMVALAAFGVWQLQQKTALQDELDILRGSHDRWGLETQQQINQLNKTIAELKAQLQGGQARTMPAAPSASGGAPAIEQMMTVLPGLPAGQGNTMRNIAGQLLASPDARLALAQSLLTSQYGEFIRSLHLPPEQEKRLKDRLLATLSAQMELQQKFSTGEAGRDDLAAANMGQQVDAIMADSLDRQQLDSWQRWKADAPARAQAQLQTMTRLQLATQAPGLTDANRDLVAATIAKAMTAPQPRTAGPQSTSKVMEDVETSLQGVLPDDQMKIAREYLRQREQFNAVLRQ